jgi:hypothetical protein
MKPTMNDQTERPDILLMIDDALSDEFEADFFVHFNRAQSNVAVIRQSGGPYAGLELYLPTAVGLFIAAGFFNGFLQEAGKDAYAGLKGAVIALWQRATGLKVTAIGSAAKKVSPNQPYSLAFSITGDVAPTLRFKLLIQTDIELETVEAGVAAFLSLIDDLLNDRIEKTNIEALLTYKPVGGTVLVTFDPKLGKIIPVNAFEKID